VRRIARATLAVFRLIPHALFLTPDSMDIQPQFSSHVMNGMGILERRARKTMV